jgi:putative ABC transport system permease protein
MRAWKIVGLAFAGLRRNPLRLTLTTLGVTIAASALALMMALAIGIQRQVETPFRALGLLNNIQVKPKDDAAAKDWAAKDAGPQNAAAKDAAAKDAAPLDDAALDRMAKLSGVVAAYPDVRLRGIKIRHADKEETAMAMAMPREAALLGLATEVIVAGRFFGESSDSEAIIGTELARGLGFKSPQEAVGEKVTIEAAGLLPDAATSFIFQKKQLTLTVVGVYDVPSVVPGPMRRSIILPVELMKDIPGIHFEAALNGLKAGAAARAPGYTSATVRVRDPSDLDAVESQVKEMGFQTRTVMSQLQGMRKFFIAIQLLLTVVGTVGLTIAALGIVNTLLMSVLERYQEIGICKAIGASDGDLFVLFLTEAATIGLLGGVSGLALGWLVSRGMEMAASAYARSQGIAENLELFGFPPWLLGATIGFAVVVSMVAGVYPALRAARVDPIRALRSQ